MQFQLTHLNWLNYDNFFLGGGTFATLHIGSTSALLFSAKLLILQLEVEIVITFKTAEGRNLKFRTKMGEV